jgi:hypothetical protein
MPEQWHGYLRQELDWGNGLARVEGFRRISDPSSCEKNWSPITMGPHLYFMYRVDQMQKQSERVKLRCAHAVDNISGGSPYIAWRNGYLSVVHEAIAHPSHGRRIYQHRFVWLDSNASRPILSLPFVFREVQIEFAAGLALTGHSGKLVISFGERDAKAWLCCVSQEDVAAMLGIDR